MKEKSYMVAVSRNDETIKDINGIMTRLSNNSEVKLKSHKFEKGLDLKVEVEGYEYEVEVFPIDFEIPPLYRTQHLFPDVDVEAVEKANVGLVVAMEFNENPLGSYHAQLKIITALIPDVLAVFDDLLKDNPIYMISTEETQRMKAPAYERISYMLKAAQNSENKILIKIGLDIDEEFREEQNDFEHIWFELKSATDSDVTCELTQEPYYVKDMHVGSIGTYTFGRITDWLIFTKERRLTADDVYLMELG